MLLLKVYLQLLRIIGVQQILNGDIEKRIRKKGIRLFKEKD